jgi:hypothetical protein
MKCKKICYSETYVTSMIFVRQNKPIDTNQHNVTGTKPDYMIISYYANCYCYDHCNAIARIVGWPVLKNA